MQQLVSLVAQNVGLPSTANRAHKYQFIKVTFIPNYVTVLYCIVLHCIVLYCIVLHCIVLHFIVFYLILLIFSHCVYLFTDSRAIESSRDF